MIMMIMVMVMMLMLNGADAADANDDIMVMVMLMMMGQQPHMPRCREHPGPLGRRQHEEGRGVLPRGKGEGRADRPGRTSGG